MSFVKFKNLLCVCLAFVLVTGCSSVSKNASIEEIENNDPYEKGNRSVFRFNMMLDEYVLEPVAAFYDAALPNGVKTGISNELTTLEQPISTINYAIAGDGKRASAALVRFFTNLFLGFFGLVDVYKELSLNPPVPYKSFGSALAVRGVPTGPYVMVPFFGPYCTREIFGDVVDSVADPIYYVPKPKNRLCWGIGKYLLGEVSSRAMLLEAYRDTKRQAFDLYATLRSMYWQKIRKTDATVDFDEGPTPYDDFDDEE